MTTLGSESDVRQLAVPGVSVVPPAPRHLLVVIAQAVERSNKLTVRDVAAADKGLDLQDRSLNGLVCELDSSQNPLTRFGAT
jgi:hypothetical protein